MLSEIRSRACERLVIALKSNDAYTYSEMTQGSDDFKLIAPKLYRLSSRKIARENFNFSDHPTYKN